MPWYTKFLANPNGFMHVLEIKATHIWTWIWWPYGRLHWTHIIYIYIYRQNQYGDINQWWLGWWFQVLPIPTKQMVTCLNLFGLATKTPLIICIMKTSTLGVSRFEHYSLPPSVKQSCHKCWRFPQPRHFALPARSRFMRSWQDHTRHTHSEKNTSRTARSVCRFLWHFIGRSKKPCRTLENNSCSSCAVWESSQWYLRTFQKHRKHDTDQRIRCQLNCHWAAPFGAITFWTCSAHFSHTTSQSSQQHPPTLARKHQSSFGSSAAIGLRSRSFQSSVSGVPWLQLPGPGVLDGEIWDNQVRLAQWWEFYGRENRRSTDFSGFLWTWITYGIAWPPPVAMEFVLRFLRARPLGSLSSTC